MRAITKLSLAVSLALGMPSAQATLWIAPATRVSDTVAGISGSTLRLSLADMYLSSDQSLVALCQTYLAGIEVYAPALRDGIKQTDTYKNYVAQLAYYQEEVSRLTTIKNGGTISITPTSPTISATPTTSDGFSPITTVKDVPTGANILQTGTPSLVDLSKTAAVWQSSSEYVKTNALSQVHPESAWMQGWTGRGVTVAVIDTGYGTAQKTDRPLNMAQGRNFLSDAIMDTNDTVGHGTHVAGIIAAPGNGIGIVGVAPEATILPLKTIGNVGGLAGITPVAVALEYAANQRVAVANISAGVFLAYDTTTRDTTAIDSAFGRAYLDAVRGGTTVVVSAGNDGLNCKPYVSRYDWTRPNPVVSTSLPCSFPAALPAVAGYESLTTSRGGWIAVGAVDASNNLATFSNRAGIMAPYYLVAPGVNVVSTSNILSGATTTKSGTSMSAPVVSGAVALLSQKFPYLTGSQQASILFQTATDLGVSGVDEVYGNGLLNIAQAMQPIGALRLPSGQNVGTATKPLIGMTIGINSSVAGTVASSQVLKNAMALDLFNRSYAVDLTRVVYSNASSFSFDALPTYSLGNLSISTDGISGVKAIGYQLKDGWAMKLGSDSQPGTNGTYLRFSRELPMEGLTSYGIALDYGILHAAPDASGLINKISSVDMLGASAWLRFDPKINESYTFGLRIPLNPVSGNVTVRAPVARTMAGDVVYQSERMGLAKDPAVALFATYGMSGKNSSFFSQAAVERDEMGKTSPSVTVNYVVRF